MKVAVACNGEFVSNHFGKCDNFLVYEIENNRIVKKTNLKNPGHLPGKIPEYIKSIGADYIISAGMGIKAIELFEKYGIKRIIGYSGKADDIINDFLQGKIKEQDEVCQKQSNHNCS